MRVSDILARSAERQRNLDTLLQIVKNLNVNGQHFHHHVMTVLSSDITTVINDLRNIEQILFTTIGDSYTNTPYYNNGTYGFLPPNRSFTSISAAIAFYKTYIAQLIADINAEHIVTTFIGDSEGQNNSDTNVVYQKSTNTVNGLHWADYESAILTALADIQSTLNGETPDIS